MLSGKLIVIEERSIPLKYNADVLIYNQLNRYIFFPSLLSWRDDNDSIIHSNSLVTNVSGKKANLQAWIQHQKTFPNSSNQSLKMTNSSIELIFQK